MKKLFLLITILFIFSSSIYAGRMTDEWKLTIKKDYAGVISKLKDKSGKTAEAYYLLGKAYYAKNDNLKAAEAWKECLKITKSNKGKKKWSFLYPPKSLRKKKLDGKKVKKLINKFQEQYEEVKGAAANELRNSAKANRRKADQKKIDAKRNIAKAKRATAKANAKTEAIKSKQRVADRKARANNRRGNRRHRRASSGGGSTLGAIIVGLIILAIIILVIVKGKTVRGGGAPMRTRRRVGRYDIYYDDDIFDMGPFWYDGIYFRNEMDFYDRYGYHYTNRMYADGYNEYADRYENGYDEALDNEILDDIDQREDYRNEAADANYDADMDNADADEYNNEARYDEEDANEYDDAGDAFDDDIDESAYDDEDEPEDEEW